jgi:hypothetical protein
MWTMRMALYQCHDTKLVFVPNKSFESDSEDLRGANGVGQQDVGPRVVF